MTKQSSGISRVWRCRFQAPVIFGASTASRSSCVISASDRSRRTIAAWKTPRSGGAVFFSRRNAAASDLAFATSAEIVATETPRRRISSMIGASCAEGRRVG